MRMGTKVAALAAAASLPLGLCFAPTASARDHETRAGSAAFGHSATSLDALEHSRSRHDDGTRTGILTRAPILPFSLSVDDHRVY